MNLAALPDQLLVRRVDERRKEDAEQIVKLGAETNRLSRELGKLTLEVEKTVHQAATYKEALESANDRIRVQNESVRKQNEQVEEIKRMVQDRNLTVHTYHEPLAEQIHARLPDYSSLLVRWLGALRKRLAQT